MRSSRRSNNPRHWSLPGGGLDHGEDPHDGVIREFLEETGLDIAIERVREVSADVGSHPWRNVLLHHDRVVFDVRIIGGELTKEVNGSSDLPAWVDPSELRSLNLLVFTARVLGLSGPPQDAARRPARADETGETAASGRGLGDNKKVMRFGAYGVVTDQAERVLLSLIAEDYPGAGSWHLPGGGTDFGEQPAEGLLREIYEESEQEGVVNELLRVGSRHNPAAMGPEGEPLDWYTVRAIFRVTVPKPTVPRVTEAAGSTAGSRWFTRAELADIPLSDLARRELPHLD